MHFVKIPARATKFNPSPVQIAVLWRLCIAQFQYEKRGRTGTPFFRTDRDLAREVGCSNHTIWEAKNFWKDKGIIRFWIGEKNRTYYVVQFDVPKKSKYPLQDKSIERRAKKRAGKSQSLNELIPPHLPPPK